jgi:hypothetical protein
MHILRWREISKRASARSEQIPAKEKADSQYAVHFECTCQTSGAATIDFSQDKTWKYRSMLVLALSTDLKILILCVQFLF